MPLTGVHLLLSYQCTYECDHCFVWSSPRAGGTMSLEAMTTVPDQARDLGTVTGVYFEGGEPFLVYPLMVEGIRLARERGFSTGVVTNCYCANTAADAELWLRPLRDLEVADVSVSSDVFQSGDDKDLRPGHAVEAARWLGIDEAVISIDPPALCSAPDEKGLPIVGGSVRLRGRAAVNLTQGLPRRPWADLDECMDGYGNVRLCQGVLLGNVNDRPLRELIESHEPHANPIIGPLLAGGPAELVRVHDLPHENGYVDACPLCYETRCALREGFPQQLGPPQVYGAEETT